MKKLVFVFIALFFSATASFAQSSDVQVVKLNQTPGVFDQKTLNLKPGRYIFELTNENVKHDVGFWLRESDQKKPLKNSDKGGLIKTGKTVRTGVVELKPGNYTYSCPLNPTPNYKLTVK
jgi:plastocyanin